MRNPRKFFILILSVLVVAGVCSCDKSDQVKRLEEKLEKLEEKLEEKKAPASPEHKSDHLLYIKIDRQGKIEINEKKVSLNELKGKIGQIKKTSTEEVRIAIVCDPDTTLDFIQPVFNVIAENKIKCFLQNGDKIQRVLLPPNAVASDEEMPPMLHIGVFKVNDDSEEYVYYFVNTSKDGGGHPMEFEELKSYLKLVADTDKETMIVLNCDPNAAHKKLIKVLDLCCSLGLTNLYLIDATQVSVLSPQEYIEDPVFHDVPASKTVADPAF